MKDFLLSVLLEADRFCEWRNGEYRSWRDTRRRNLVSIMIYSQLNLDETRFACYRKIIFGGIVAENGSSFVESRFRADDRRHLQAFINMSICVPALQNPVVSLFSS